MVALHPGHRPGRNLAERLHPLLRPAGGAARSSWPGRARLHVYPDAKRAVLELRDAIQHTVTLTEPDDSYRVEPRAPTRGGDRRRGLCSLLHRRKADRGEKYRGARRRACRSPSERLPLAWNATARDVERRNVPNDDIQSGRSTTAPDRRRARPPVHCVEIHKKFRPAVRLLDLRLPRPSARGARPGRAGGRAASRSASSSSWSITSASRPASRLAMNGRISPFLGMWGGEYPLRRRQPRPVRGLGQGVALSSPVLSPPAARPRGAARSGRRVRQLAARACRCFPNILDRYSSGTISSSPS